VRSARVELILDTLKAVRGAKDLSKEVETVSDKLGEAAVAGKAAGKAIDDAGDEMSEAARAAAKLDREVEKLTGSLREMAIAQALTGENFGKQMRSQETELRRLARSRKLLGDVGDDAGKGFIAQFSRQLNTGLTSLPMTGMLSVPVVAAGISVAPLLAAALSGAVIGGAGIGGVVGGLIVASKDVRVAAAGKQLADGLQSRLERAAGSFVQPAIKGIHEIQRSLDTIDIEQIFGDSSKFVDPLSRGLGDAIESIGNGVEKLVANAGPVIAVISTGIAGLGEHLGKGLESLSDNGDDAAAALKTVFEIMNSGIDTTVRLVDVLTELYGWGQKIGADFALQTFLKVTGTEMDNTGLSAHRAGAEAGAMGDEFQKAADQAEVLKNQQTDLKVYTDAVKTAQDALTRSLGSLGGATSLQGQQAAALTTAMDNLYGAAIRNTDANEAYQASWDALSESVKANKGTLDIHTTAGRANRDALEGLLTATNENYTADIAAGIEVDAATKKHQNRIAAVKEEAKRLGLNTTATQHLIDTYGRIPGAKTTDLILDGVRGVIAALKDLYVFQRALAEGRSLESMEQKLRTGSDSGPAKKYGGFAEGGWTGPGPKHQPAGVVHADEWVVPKAARRKVEQQAPGFLAELNATGQVPGYAGGGLVAPVDTSRRWPFGIDVSGTHIMSRAQAASKVAPSFGNWPSSPSAQRGDSGVWRAIVALIRSTGPMSGSFGNAYRPGDPLWHGSGRAVDWMGFNQDGLASFLAARRPLELIHRTATRDYAYTRGVNKGSFNEALMNAHRNHVHIAMQNGGVIPEPVFGVGRSGRTYSFAENGRPERVLSAGQSAAGNSVTVHAPITVNGATQSVEQIARAVSREIGRTVDIYARGVA
jgi:hypothetical protein